MAGTLRITADQVIGREDQPVRVYSVTLVSGGTGSTLSLNNGDAAGDTANKQIDGTANVAVTVNYNGGALFTDGCFANVDANISYATIEYEVEVP